MWPGSAVVKEVLITMRYVVFLTFSLMCVGSPAAAGDSMHADAIVVPYAGDGGGEDAHKHVELKRVLSHAEKLSFDTGDHAKNKLSAEERDAISRELREITNGGVYDELSQSRR